MGCNLNVSSSNLDQCSGSPEIFLCYSVFRNDRPPPSRSLGTVTNNLPHIIRSYKLKQQWKTT